MQDSESTAQPFPHPGALRLRPGDLVEVRSREQILATLDRNACLDGMPFMPEMLRYCGQRFRVSKRAEKACDTILTGQGRRVRDAVYLEDLRCDGSAHGGCQAMCRIWWKEAWLLRVSAGARIAQPDRGITPAGPCSEEDVRRASSSETVDGPVYTCQVTGLLNFTEELRWWDPRHYAREVLCGNVGPIRFVAVVARAAWNILRRRLGLNPVPDVQGRCRGKTPAGTPLGLAPGDWIVVKSKEEIEHTLNAERRNRGLWFDVEMLPYCGRRMRLLQKVDRIIDEKTGRMRTLPNDCWIVEGAYCGGYLSRGRYFCTRAIYPFWREIWLRRAD